MGIFGNWNNERKVRYAFFDNERSITGCGSFSKWYLAYARYFLKSRKKIEIKEGTHNKHFLCLSVNTEFTLELKKKKNSCVKQSNTLSLFSNWKQKKQTKE